jgi:hypothetical protein
MILQKKNNGFFLEENQAIGFQFERCELSTPWDRACTFAAPHPHPMCGHAGKRCLCSRIVACNQTGVAQPSCFQARECLDTEKQCGRHCPASGPSRPFALRRFPPTLGA